MSRNTPKKPRTQVKHLKLVVHNVLPVQRTVTEIIFLADDEFTWHHQP